MDRLYFKKILTVVLLTLPSIILASSEDINIISWWGYLYPDKYKYIENYCDVKIHVDEYYSNPEFLRRIKKIKYDIAIYSDTVYQTYKNISTIDNIDITSNSIDGYQKDIKRVYLKSKYDTNTVYFQIALTGFLWNPENIQINESDSIEDIFRNSTGKTVVLLDEHVEIMNLLSKIQGSSFGHVSLNEINQFIKGTKIIISSNLGKIYKKNDFAFAFTWSGEALEKMNLNKLNYKFMVHPKLSHWSKDLLTAQTNKNSTKCVAQHLVSRNFIEKVSKSSYYFSPYSTISNNNALYQELYNNFLSVFSVLDSLPEITVQKYEDLNKDWNHIKMKLNDFH